MAIEKKDLNIKYLDRDELESILSRILSLLEMGLVSDFDSHTRYTWHNYLSVIDELVLKLKEEILK